MVDGVRCQSKLAQRDYEEFPSSHMNEFGVSEEGSRGVQRIYGFRTLDRPPRQQDYNRDPAGRLSLPLHDRRSIPVASDIPFSLNAEMARAAPQPKQSLSEQAKGGPASTGRCQCPNRILQPRSSLGQGIDPQTSGTIEGFGASQEVTWIGALDNVENRHHG
ncbi:hypothetical protein SUGI_0846740 [Cryptomeria japonica]|nr:hypothetical protein SUGI_0846740 [Cryptomeria japonica]